MKTRYLTLLIAGLTSIPFFTAPGQGATYEVGPGLAHENVGDVSWEALLPGDTVLIHWRPESYREKWVICRRGTSDAWITVRGVPSATGQLPIIDGRDATTRNELNFWNEERGVIKVGGANQPPDTLPAYIRIERLDIRSGRPPYSFTGRYGLSNYVNNCAAVYVEKVEHLVVRDCILRDCGNGFFAGSLSSDVLIERCSIHDNGIEGRYYEHNNYTEVNGIIFQFNHFGPLREGCGGNNLKDRSAGAVIRYNWIESGNRQLDLVDSDHASLIDLPEYRQTFVYGNILIEPDGAGNSQICHYGGDSGDEDSYRKGTLYFYNNTVISTRSGNTTLFRLSTNDEHCDCRNNIIYVTATGNRLAMLNEAGQLDLYSNWTKPDWTSSHGTLTGTITDCGGAITGDEPGFMDFEEQNFHLLESSSCVDAGSALAAEVLPDHGPVLEYVRHRSSGVRSASGALDLGAYEYAGPPGSVLVTY